MPEQHGPAAPRPKSDSGIPQADDQATRVVGGASAQDATRVLRPEGTPAEVTRLEADVTRLGAPDPRPDSDATRLGPATPPESTDATQLGGDMTRLQTGPRASGDDSSGPLAVGSQFGTRYRITRLLGLGGMGAVYEAWDAELGVSVALKVIRPEISDDQTAAKDMERRFKRELLLARQVTHKNVVRIHDLGEINGIKYITMPYIEGKDLATVLKEDGRMPLARTLAVARQSLSGLVAAHAEGIVHRDLKPANIMVDTQGNALLMDFGIARSIGMPGPPMPGSSGGRPLPGGVDPTLIGAVVGTIAYMAPEQAQAAEVDHRADVYAFGLILRDMLLGPGRQKSAATALGELQKRMDAPPPPIRSIDQTVPETVDRIVTRCLQVDPKDRYQTAADLLADLDRLDDEGKLKPEPRHLTRKLALVGAVVLAAVIAGTYWLARTPPATQHAPISVLIADFDNQTGDAAFDGSVEQAMGIALEGASFVTTFSRDQAKKIAGQLQPGSRVDEGMAKLISKSEGIKVIVAGSIVREGSGFKVSARAIDPAADPARTQPLATASGTAANRDGVLSTVNRLAASLRGELGDTETESARLAAGETFTASSLEAVKQYTLAQDLAGRGRDADAIPYYQQAIQADPNFGRAYSGLATSLFHLGRQDEAGEQWKKALALMSRMTDREKYRTLGGYNLAFAGNYEQAIANYSTLVNLYPSDFAGLNNLAFAYFNVLNFPKALEIGKKAVDLYPGNTIIGNNYALYAMYASEFDTAAEQSQKLVAADPGFMKNYLPLAVVAVLKLDDAAARDAYAKMASTGAQGASLSAMGLADLELYRGRWSDAEHQLSQSIAVDQQQKANGPAAEKTIALAETFEAQGRRAQALDAAQRALKISREPGTQLPAAQLFARLGQAKEAAAIVSELDNTLQTQNRAYARVIEGDLALRANKLADAVDAFRASVKLIDMWLPHFALGVAYVQAGHFAEGLTELEICQRRRGEATAIFLDDTPSLRYLATLPYWLARAQEGVGQQQDAVSNYKAFLAIRADAAPKDALVVDARRRAGTQ
ncbi:MAG TPA: serine/threonine-protein kinase [Vicinamibacterales bacterium]|nr:serine/threonine-protein kinase [Vicinamibacterales bacterium]